MKIQDVREIAKKNGVSFQSKFEKKKGGERL